MNDPEILQAFVPLYDDVADTDQSYVKKPLLAHYTSLSVLERILETDEVWFSNPLFMNDLEEVRFGVLRGVELARRSQDIRDALRSEARARLFTQHFDHYFELFDSQHVLDTYVLCLSEHNPEDHDGMLSMWRGYGSNGGGAAIVLDTGKLRAVEGAPLIIAMIHYGSADERLAWLEGTLSKFARIIRELSLADEKLHLAAFALFDRIKIFSLFSKRRGFSEEREWRIVYVRDRDHENKLASMFHYWIGPRGVEPKLRLKVAPIGGWTDEDLSLAKIVERIILGPSVSSPLAKASVLRMLDRLGKPSLKERVYASTIPFRPA